MRQNRSAVEGVVQSNTCRISRQTAQVESIKGEENHVPIEPNDKAGNEGAARISREVACRVLVGASGGGRNLGRPTRARSGGGELT